MENVYAWNSSKRKKIPLQKKPRGWKLKIKFLIHKFVAKKCFFDWEIIINYFQFNVLAFKPFIITFWGT